MTLQDLRPGSSATIVGYTDDLPGAHRDRLEDLGFRPGTVVTCTRQPGFGSPHVYVLHGTVYAMDRDVARGVEVAA